MLTSQPSRLQRGGVSVVIPAYEAASFIERALASVLAQTTGVALEVVVVDDGSTDNTAAVAVRHAGEGMRIIRHRRRRGAAAACNTGARNALGEYVAFLDANAEWLPEKLAQQLPLLAPKNVALVGCETHLIDWNGDNTGNIYGRTPPVVGGDAWRSLLARPSICMPSVVTRRELLLRLGGFNEHLVIAEDQDMWIRLALAGDVAYVPQALVHVHSHRGSLSEQAWSRNHELVVPLILRHLATVRHRLTEDEAVSILSERYAHAARTAFFSGEVALGAWALGHVVRLGHHVPRNVLAAGRSLVAGVLARARQRPAAATSSVSRA